MNILFKKLTAMSLAILMLVMVGCTAPAPSEAEPTTDSTSVSESAEPESESAEMEENTAEEDTATEMLDRNGNPYEIPASADKIISLSPSITEILVGLGLQDNIVGADNYSLMDAFGDEPVADTVTAFDLGTPDAEQAIALEADIIFSSGLSYYEGGNPLEVASEHGAFVTDIPSATSINAIREDIKFIGNITGKQAEAEQMIADMDARIEAVVDTIGDNATGETLYFEIGSGETLYSQGADTFIHEMIELIGCTNIFADQSSWISVAEEAVIDANPDIILTNDNYTSETPVEAIKTRTGWDVVGAVSGDRVFFINTNSSSRPNHNIVIALEEMAAAVYPDLFA